QNISYMKPWKELAQEDKKVLLYGTAGFEGIIPTLDRLYKQTESDKRREQYEQYMTLYQCDTCAGKRLKPESLAVTIANKDIIELTDMSIADIKQFFEQLTLNTQQQQIASLILKEIHDRLS